MSLRDNIPAAPSEEPGTPKSRREALLSIIIVTYQSRQEIGPCLTSIPRDLLGSPVEIVVVDNASTDGTLCFVTQAYPDVHALSSGGNLGFSKANNLGYLQTCAPYILFLNPDTIMSRQTLEHCLQRIQTEPDIGIFSPRLVLEDGQMDLACRRAVPTAWDGLTRATGLARFFPRWKLCAGYNLTYLPEHETYTVGAVNGAFMMTSRRVLTRIGLFDEQFFMYGDDLDLCLRCSQQGFRVVYDGRHAITHLKGRSSSKEYRAMSKALFIGTKQFYLKHFNPQDSMLVRWKYDFLFWLWHCLAWFLAQLRNHKAARPI